MDGGSLESAGGSIRPSLFPALSGMYLMDSTGGEYGKAGREGVPTSD